VLARTLFLDARGSARTVMDRRAFDERQVTSPNRRALLPLMFASRTDTAVFVDLLSHIGAESVPQSRPGQALLGELRFMSAGLSSH